MNRIRGFAAVLTALLLLGGCAKHYVVTAPLAQPLAPPLPCIIGSIGDELPGDMEEGKKPSAEEVNRLKRHLEEELARKGLARILPAGDAGAAYEVTGSFLEFRRGSGAVRFFVGFGLGNAEATVALKLIDSSSGAVLFGGNFNQTVSSWAEGGDAVFLRISQDFAKALAKDLKKVAPDVRLTEKEKEMKWEPMP